MHPESPTEMGRVIASMKKWHERTCAWCGAEFKSQAIAARFCREAHRKAAMRERQREVARAGA